MFAWPRRGTPLLVLVACAVHGVRDMRSTVRAREVYVA